MGYYPIFTYGSLKSGLENSIILSDSLLVGGTTTTREFNMISVADDYPALFDDSHAVPERHEYARGRVQGELYLVTDEILERLNVLEHLGVMYTISEEEIDPVSFTTGNADEGTLREHNFSEAMVYVALPNMMDFICNNDDFPNSNLNCINNMNGIVSWIHPIFDREEIVQLYQSRSQTRVSANLIRRLNNRMNANVNI